MSDQDKTPTPGPDKSFDEVTESLLKLFNSVPPKKTEPKTPSGRPG